MKYLKQKFRIKYTALQSVEKQQPKKRLPIDTALHVVKSGTAKLDYADLARHNYLYTMMKHSVITV